MPSTHQLICNDCGHVSECGNLISFNTFSPPPSGYSYDDTCLKCSSANTEKIEVDGLDSDIPF